MAQLWAKGNLKGLENTMRSSCYGGVPVDATAAARLHFVATAGAKDYLRL